MLDEATAGLDPIARDEVLDLLRDFMAEGDRGILMSTHITSDLEMCIRDRTMDILPLERRERFQDKCRLIIERYGLSEREGEIMIMFAKGRNLAYIQDKLFISKSTVSTHRQHIYKKLGIHSQQELLDLVQAANPYGE